MNNLFLFESILSKAPHFIRLSSNFFDIKQHSNSWNQSIDTLSYATCAWSNSSTGSIWLKCINTYLTSTSNISTRNYNAPAPGGLGGYVSSTADPRYHMEQDNEFVFVLRSGDHARGNNTSGLSLRIYKKSDFDLSWDNTIRDYDNALSKMEIAATMVIDRNEGHDLWINGYHANYNSSNPQGVVDHGFEYKEVIWDYRCFSDEEVEEYLLYAFPPGPPEPESESHPEPEPEPEPEPDNPPEPEPEPEPEYVNSLGFSMPEDQEFTTTYPTPEISLNRPGAFQNGITLILQSESRGNMGTNDTLFTLIGGNTSVGEHEQLIRWRVKDGSNAYEGVEIARHDDTNLIIKPSYNEHYTLYTWIYQAIGDSISVNRYHINNEGRLINEYIYNSFVWVVLGCFGISGVEKFAKK